MDRGTDGPISLDDEASRLHDKGRKVEEGQTLYSLKLASAVGQESFQSESTEAQLAERLLDAQEVGGASPPLPTRSL